jgi:hypothetical protein
MLKVEVTELKLYRKIILLLKENKNMGVKKDLTNQRFN